ncbi:MAG TPA: PQQ-binding-like beta-propeller repeat protein [Sedimentisphaerales bacterium]|nr:PQQ-binding-like beta-propeller repeat protein [Sedimentisphaerales bacterium]
MKSNSDNNTESKSTSLRYPTAVRIAVVGGVFSVIVAALLAVNYVQRTVFDERRIAELDRLKIEILSRPNDEQLMGRIRQLDLEVRRDRIRRVDFSRKGGWLLAAGLVVMVVGIKWADTLRRKLPHPELRGDVRAEQVTEATWARRAVTAGLLLLGASALLLTLIPQVDFVKSSFEVGPDEVWPGFRGPGGVGVGVTTNVPVKWNGGTGEGILWKKKVPLRGHNSPIAWGDRVFVSGADANERQVYCFDADSGDLLWRGGVETEAGKTSEPLDVMEDTGFAAPTCVTDGKRVCAIFANGDVGCFDYKGKQLWTRGLGVPESAYGYASSLAMYRNLVLIQYDQATEEDEKSKMIALNVLSGQTVWETKRPVGGAWTSPIVDKVGGSEQLITCGDPWVIAYNPANGEELWRAECMGDDLAPSPIYAGGLVLAIESNVKMVAIRPDGRGDVTKTHILWMVEDGIPDIPSPVSNGELVFLLTSDGTLTCYRLTDHAKLWEQDLGTGFNASPTIVGNRLYLLSEKGVMIIAEFAEGYKEAARYELGEECHASPAFVSGRIYIRGLENLYCIGSTASQEP